MLNNMADHNKRYLTYSISFVQSSDLAEKELFHLLRSTAVTLENEMKKVPCCRGVILNEEKAFSVRAKSKRCPIGRIDYKIFLQTMLKLSSIVNCVVEAKCFSEHSENLPLL